MVRLFDRSFALTIASPVPTELGFFNLQSNAIVVKDLRIVFSIEKSLTKDPNKATITVYNLSETTRDALGRKPLRIVLEAGYDGDPRRIFAGDVVRVSSNKLPVDWETKITCSDGARAFREARVNRSLPPGSTALDVIKESAKSMGLSVPTSVDSARQLLSQFVSGVSIQGHAEREMSRALAPHGLGWSVQDGSLQILGEDQVRAGEAVVVSEETGMIGSPVHGDPKKKGGRPRLSVKMMLDGRVWPGVKLKVESRVTRGLYRVEGVKHSGDSIGGSWETEAECKPL